MTEDTTTNSLSQPEQSKIIDSDTTIQNTNAVTDESTKDMTCIASTSKATMNTIVTSNVNQMDQVLNIMNENFDYEDYESESENEDNEFDSDNGYNIRHANKLQMTQIAVHSLSENGQTQAIATPTKQIQTIITLKIFVEKVYDLACQYKRKPFKLIPENLNVTIKNFHLNVMKSSKRKSANEDFDENHVQNTKEDDSKTPDLNVELVDEDEFSEQLKDPVLYLRIFKCLLHQMDQSNLFVAFPREALKFFITTHKVFVNILDFQESSKKVVVEKRKRNNKPIGTGNGGILSEYCKSIGNFKSQINKCNASDAEALKFIIDKNIHFVGKLYKPSMIILKDKFVTITNDNIINDYHKISMSNHKHYCVCVNCNIALVWDNNQFVIPTMAIEREANLSLLIDACKSSDLWIIDILVPIQKIRSYTDVKIVDVLQTNTANADIMNLPYDERLRVLKSKFTKFSIPTIENKNYNDSHIQVPNNISLNDSYNRYFYVKPGYILAIIGICKNEVLLAFKRDDGDLEFKLKQPLTGSISMQLSSLKRVPIRVAPQPFSIKDSDGNCYKIYDLPSDNIELYLYEKFITVEMRENQKINHYTIGPITNVADFKPIVQKDINVKQSQNPLFYKDEKNLYSVGAQMKLNMTASQREAFANFLLEDLKSINIPLNYKKMKLSSDE